MSANQVNASDLDVERLFSEVISAPRWFRNHILATSDAHPNVVAEVLGLVAAHESPSPILNQSLLTDIDELDSGFLPDVAGDFDPRSIVSPRFGEQLGRYEIGESIGQGGMSVVYRAEQTAPFRRTVALKLLRSNLLSSKDVDRFLVEQRTLAAVAHPNIATLFDGGRDENEVPFMAIEYVDGDDIAKYCHRTNAPVELRLHLFTQLARALRFAHSKGVIHRDVKPSNILVSDTRDEPQVKLIDFGIAQSATEEIRHTQTGQRLGSPRYMSPEQLYGADVGEATDVYAAGLVLFEVITGTPYRRANDIHSVESNFRQVCELPSERIAKTSNNDRTELAVPRVCRAMLRKLDWIVSRAIQPTPAKRYESIDQMLADVEAVLERRKAANSQPSLLQRTRQNAHRHPCAFWASVVLAIMISLGGTWAASSYIAASHAEQIRVEQFNSSQAAANDLVMRLLASDMYELSVDNYNTSLIPAYEHQVAQIKASGNAHTDGDRTAYGILGVLYAMSGDFAASDRLFSFATVGDGPNAEKLRSVRDKVLAKYKELAVERLQNCESNEVDRRCALEMLTLGRCCMLEGNRNGAQLWLNRSLAFFEADSSEHAEVSRIRAHLSAIDDAGGVAPDSVPTIQQSWRL